MSVRCVVVLAGAIAGPSLADITPHAGMLRQPAVSESKIAFVYANQMWTAPRSGGTATLVAAPPVRPSLPRFSPDGKTIAFMANFDGNTDLYTVPVAGGELSRVTHHPAQEVLCGWSDDSHLLFFAPGVSNSGPGRLVRLYTVPVAGGLPEKLPMPYAGFGAVSRDGKTVAFAPLSTDDRTWRRYRGGMATDLWTMDLDSGAAKQITDWEGTDTIPMWGFNRGASTVYYLSDNGPEHRLNIWAYDTGTGAREQVTKFADQEVRFPSIGPGPVETRGRGEIVFQLGSQLMLLDLDTKESRAVSITIPGARPRLREQIKDASDTITAARLSPSGKRVLFTARGDIYSAPAKEGPTRNLTRTDGVFERDAAWSPDGRWIAYLSDESGEYELYLRASDARPAKPEGEGGKDGKKAEESDPDTETAELPAEPIKLTNFGPGFRYNPVWSPDSRHIVLTDKAGAVIMVDMTFATPPAGKEGPHKLIAAVAKQIDTDPWSEQASVTWSHDSRWLCYTRSDDAINSNALWLYNLESGEKTRVTSPYFTAGSPAFDRKGNFLYFTSSREYSSPRYADVDTTFVYAGTERVMFVPLRNDVKSPLAPKSDEEEIKAPKPVKKGRGDKDKGDNEKEDKGKDEKKPDEPPADKPDDQDKPKDPPSPPSPRSGVVMGDDVGVVGAVLTSAALGQAAKPNPDSSSAEKPLVIDLANFESRVLTLPIAPGNFSGLEVNEDGKLLFVRRGSRGEDAPPSIRIFDPSDDKREEQSVADGVGGFTMSASGKKLLINRNNRWMVIDAAAGAGAGDGGGGGAPRAGGRGRGGGGGGGGGGGAGGSDGPQDVSTAGLRTMVDPRKEWQQIFTDAWRLQRDFFYVSNMHGVDWPKIKEQFGAMLADASSRDDVQFIIAEMISQLNIGHAYVQAPGDVDQAPAVNVGLLGCDFELGRDGKTGASAYRFKTIYRGAAWDADARGPLALSEPEKDRIVEGEYLLAVNGVPVDVAQDPWVSFIGLADRATTLTVNISPVMDGKQRDVLVTPVGSDQSIRYRSWIEANRAYVEKASDGKLGYIYVPNTGVEGQNDLFRQFYGQRSRAALIIDDRWNGGGQIPTRFIELLNRPVTNYWARRDGHDWTWPPDAHAGPKCMLINGQAGSGGDMFPWLFKNMKLGKVIGMRTWGGLVGISGNPQFIDGGSMSVPTFGFYKKDGTWGVEGHGVDPDIVVVDDPGKMVGGGPENDPQLAAAIQNLMDELKANPYAPPARPAAPDRSGMGIPEKDR